MRMFLTQLAYRVSDPCREGSRLLCGIMAGVHTNMRAFLLPGVKAERQDAADIPGATTTHAPGPKKKARKAPGAVRVGEASQPSGSLGAQPELWFNVALIDPDGITVWESGYVDGNGDFADVHSLDVAAGKVEYDDQLFNLQSKFLTTNIKGTDREMYLPVNIDVDQLPLLRPSNVPTTVLNHPPFVRMEGRSLPPLASRDAQYEVPGKFIAKSGKYRLASRMRSRAEPIYFMRFVEATTEMERAMNEWMLDIHPYTVEFDVRE